MSRSYCIFVQSIFEIHNTNRAVFRNSFGIRMTQIEQLTKDKSEEITEWAINYFQKNKEILQFYNINSPQQLIEKLSKPRIAESEIY